ncbi:MAG: hypothetical protein WBI40_07570 [Methylococcaceae bacterium]
MATYINPAALELSLNHLKTNCNKIVVVASYTAGDSRTTVLAGSNVLASLDITTDFVVGDFTITNSGNARVLNSPPSESDTVADNTGTATHIVFLSASDVLYATTLTSQAITAGNQVNFPTITYTANQPTV